MRVPYFRGVFICNMLSTSDARRNESDIVNLDDVITDNTRTVASSRTQRNNRVMYFDSFGNLRPKKLVRYFENDVTTIKYKRMSFQTYDQNFCGQMCRRFLQTDTREFKSSTRCEILVLVERFFRHVVDAYDEREEHHPRGELVSHHRFE